MRRQAFAFGITSAVLARAAPARAAARTRIAIVVEKGRICRDLATSHDVDYLTARLGDGFRQTGVYSTADEAKVAAVMRDRGRVSDTSSAVTLGKMVGANQVLLVLLSVRRPEEFGRSPQTTVVNVSFQLFGVDAEKLLIESAIALEVGSTRRKALDSAVEDILGEAIN